MARVSDVDTDRVASICFELLAQGDNPTFPKVYEALGRKGSAKVVQDAISAWRKDVSGKYFAQRTRPGVPDVIVSATDQLADAIWAQALFAASAGYEDDRKRIEDEMVSIRAQTAREVEEHRDQANQIAADWRASELRNEMLSRDVVALKERLQDTEGQLRARDETIAGQMALMAEKDRQLKAQHAQVLDLERERKEVYSRLDAALLQGRQTETRFTESEAALKVARDLIERHLREIEQLRLNKDAALARAREMTERHSEVLAKTIQLQADLGVAEERHAALLREHETLKTTIISSEKLEKMIGEALKAERSRRISRDKA